MYLACEAWRRHYGQLQTQAKAPDCSITYTLPGSGEHVAMPAWSQVQRGSEVVYVGPDGDEYESIDYARKAIEDARNGSGNFSALTKALNGIKEGCSEETPASGIGDLASKAPRGAVLSQHDDWKI